MKSLLIAFSAVFISCISTAWGSETPKPTVPQCPPDPRAEDLSDLLYSFEHFDKKSYDSSLAWLRTNFPAWVEKHDKQFRARYPNNESHKFFQGEMVMSYFNALNMIEGYNLKLEYLAANESTRGEKEKQFCDFILKKKIGD
jgi:hypothetical protein